MTGLLGTGTATAAAHPDLVGGQRATGDTSWMVALQYDAPAYHRYGAFGCGGTLIFRDWVVTNAHCVTDPPTAPASRAASSPARYAATAHTPIPTAAKHFTVRVGSKDRTRGGEVATVTQVVVHPGWSWGMGAPGTPQNDIALLKLDHVVNAQPIPLAGGPAAPGDKVTLYGWGADTPSSDAALPLRLQQLATTVLPPQECADAGMYGGEICTDNPNGTDGPGPGDSGGPAVEIVGGVARLVGGCSRAAAQYPGVAPTVYTSSPDFRQWIYDTARGAPVAS
ncbi:MAG: serine protease [Amycolatopsis sp.]|nr:serine protease [Amycolatopsis sp.]